MQLGLVVLAMIILSSMGHSDVLKLSKARRQRRGELSLFGLSCQLRENLLTMKHTVKRTRANWCECKIENCEACFSRNFCTKCKEGLYSHSGRCYDSCPPGKHSANNTMDCDECELGEWSQWSSCMKKNKTCGFKKGSQTRVRLPLPQIPSVDTSPAYVPPQTCAPETERRKCVVTKTPCARGKTHIQKKADSQMRLPNKMQGDLFFFASLGHTSK
uniref:R-spondin 1 n=1 Tax=Fundulus heteroclitus TaxID=8078 RepID=A0A3Q2QW87_FUNHE